MIHIAIVEDDLKMQQQLLAAIERYAKENELSYRTSVFCDGDEILENYKACYDLILLDIQMKRMDGMQAAEQIRALDADVLIVFVTQMVNFAVRGYAVSALDFLVKPIQYPSLENVLRKAQTMIRQRNTQYITMPTGKGFMRLDASKICYFESFGHRIVAHTEDGRELTITETMRRMEENFVPFGFYRCDNSYLVNLRYVEGVDLNEVVVHGARLNISRPRRKAFMEALTSYLGGVCT